MRRHVRQIFLWSWVITVPISLVGSYLIYRAVDRTYTYSVRYGGEKEELQFARIARYEASQLANFLRVNFIKGLGRAGDEPEVIASRCPRSEPCSARVTPAAIGI